MPDDAKPNRNNKIEEVARQEADRRIEDEQTLRAARRAALQEAAERDRERRRRTHRLATLGGTVEMVWGDQVDPDYLVGALFEFDPRKADAAEAARIAREGHDLTAARLAGRAARKSRLGRHDTRIAFPDQPPAELRAALKRSGFRFKPELVAWLGMKARLPEALLPALRRAGATITLVDESPSGTTRADSSAVPTAPSEDHHDEEE